MQQILCQTLIFGNRKKVLNTQNIGFKQSRALEVQGLIKGKVMKRPSVQKGMRVYGTRWIDTLTHLKHGFNLEK